MKGWQEYYLTEFMEFNPKVDVQKNQEYSFVEMPDLEPGRKLVYPSGKRKPNGLTKFQNGDTLFAKITPCLENGKISQVQGLESNIGVGSTEFFVFRGKENLSDNDFVHYLLKWYSVKRYAEKNMSGSAGHQRVPADCLHNLKLHLPPYQENKKIGALLSCLDNKIENLQRQNQTLEKIAQTLFKQWFVDFNFPDKNGKPYKDNGGEMVGSELGEIPKGWKTTRLKNMLQVKHGFAFKGEFITTEETDKILVTPGNFQIGGGFKNAKFKYYSDENIPKDYILKKNDLIITMTDLSKEGDTLGFPAFIPKIENKLILHNQRVGLVEANKVDTVFLYFLLCRREYRSHILATASGSTVRHTSPSRIYDFEFALPSENTLDLFSGTVRKLIRKMQMSSEQIQTLTKTRDTLLPKLMSGQIRVSD